MIKDIDSIWINSCQQVKTASSMFSIKSALLIFFVILIVLISAVEAEEESVGNQPTLEELLNTKISTASRYEQTIMEAPASVTIITADDIKRYGLRTLEDVLVLIRGFYISYNRSYSRVGVRGFSRPSDYNNRILLLINGLVTNDGIYGSSFTGTELCIDLNTVERIEIVRGASSALYGAGAMFTVINIITRKPQDLDHFVLNIETGSFGMLEGSIIFSDKFFDDLEILISGLWSDIRGPDLYYEEYDHPSTNYGIAENKDWEKYNGVHTIIKYGSIKLQAKVSSRTKGIPTGAFDIDFTSPDNNIEDSMGYIDLEYKTSIGESLGFTIRSYYDQYKYNGEFIYDLPNYKSYMTEEAVSECIGLETKLIWDIAVGNRFIFGAEYRNHLSARLFSRDDWDILFSGDFPFEIYSGYIQDELQITEDLSVTAGIRYDDYSTIGNALMPRIAVIYNPLKSTSIKVLYGKAFRAPNVYELYYEIPGFSKSNYYLKPEILRSYELIWEQKFSKEIFTVLSVYLYDMDNLIDQIEDTEDHLSQFRNLSEVRAKGFEIEIDGNFQSGINGSLSYAYQDAINLKTNSALTNSPKHLLKFNIIVQFLDYLYLGLNLRYESGRMTVYGNETDPFLLANLTLSIQKLFKGLDLSFQVRNLFDESYGYPGGYEYKQHVILQDGRTYHFKVGVGF